MNFSETFKQSQQLCTYSPDGAYLATCNSYKVVVRATDTLQILRLYTCLDAVQDVEWSSDSSFILSSMYKRGIVQVWSMDNPEWTCKIDEGSAGLIHARWSPDGRHVLTTATFHLRLTVWSLVNKSISYIRYTKNTRDCLDFSADGKYLAVGECRKTKDYVSVYMVSSWELVRLFETDTEELSGLKWSPDGRVLCVWEHCLWYKILIYTMDGRLLSSFKPYEWALGVKSVEWSPTSQFLAVGSYDQKVRMLNHITWKSILEFTHAPTVSEPAVVVYQETVTKPELPANISGQALLVQQPQIFSTQSRYELLRAPVELPVVQPDPEKPSPKIGVGWMKFSGDNKYLASVDDSMKTILHIWSVRKMQLFVVLKQSAPIKCVR